MGMVSCTSVGIVNQERPEHHERTDCCLEQFRIEESTRMTCDGEESTTFFYWLGINIFFIEANNCQCLIRHAYECFYRSSLEVCIDIRLIMLRKKTMCQIKAICGSVRK